ncbi:hypothetical protein GX51_01285 [Blastomyces parvus]|uniref:Very-long-chain 3-oxoacyl-CoA synthase n=1 Tax=Blastomyces parvus TaxID=2060905 RepID=A0A2B7XHE6_9EURO|nr:hypothetical protein GX51_01285 [Blastomyces parvus]
MDSIVSLISSSITLIILSASLHHHVHVRKNGPLPHASTFLKANNFLYAPASLLFFFVLVCSFESFVPLSGFGVERFLLRFCTYVRTHDEQLRYIFHLSKIYEYIDVLLVLATGGRIGWHFGFHHLTTPYLTYIRVLRHHTGWKLLASLNTLHHAFMYAYFGGIPHFRPILPFTGILQLVVGLAGEGVIASTKGNSRSADEPVVIWPHVVSMALLGMYFVLFALELAESAAMRKSGETKGTVLDGANGGGDEKGDGVDELREKLRN